MVRMIISVRQDQKDRLMALRAEGYTESGFLRALLDREFGSIPPELPRREGTRGKRNRSGKGKPSK